MVFFSMIYKLNTLADVYLVFEQGKFTYYLSFIYLLIYFDILLIRKELGGEWICIVVMGGFALVNNNKVTVLVNEAELGSVRIEKFNKFAF